MFCMFELKLSLCNGGMYEQNGDEMLGFSFLVFFSFYSHLQEWEYIVEGSLC
jgi:hypothetical protein